MSDKTTVTMCRSIRKRIEEERWNRDMLLGILGTPWSMEDGRVEVEPNLAAPGRTQPTVNPEVEAGPTATKSRNEWDGRRVCISKKMVP